jgi:N-acetylmuramoyl-L-alanine amidase
MTQACPEEGSNRGLVRRRLRLTRNPEIPCVLMEGGYLSHPAESRLISNTGYRQRLAGAIAQAICSQAALGDAGTGPLPPPLTAPPSRHQDKRE